MLTTELKNKIAEVANRLGANPLHLQAIIATETDGTFSPSIKNYAGSGATGLIQFMPSTAKSLGTSTEALARMTAVEQMEFVYKYLKPYANKLKTFADFYLAVFYPAAISKPIDWSFPKSITAQNTGIDLNKNGIITKEEFIIWANKKAQKRGYIFEFIKNNKTVLSIGTVLIGLSFFF